MKLKKQPQSNSMYIERKKFSVLNQQETKPKIIQKEKEKKVEFNKTISVKSTKNQKSIKYPNEFFEEWPSDEEIKEFYFGLSVIEELYHDNFFDKINLSTLLNYEIKNIEWKRPKDIYASNIIINEILIKKKINLNPKFIVDFILSGPSNRKLLSNKLSHPDNVEMNNFLSENVMTLSRVLRHSPSFFIVDTIQRTESLSYYNQNKNYLFLKVKTKNEPEKGVKDQKEAAINKVLNTLLPNMTKNRIILKNAVNDVNIVAPEETVNLIEFLPTNINSSDWTCNYVSWISSVFQLIKDLKLKDINDDSSIWSKIYPQDDNGIPIYNPSGRYWIKLYFMGKPRKIEVDDRIPVTEYDEMIFPKTRTIEELWPVILTKAIIKLFYFKINNTSYIIEKIGDCAIFYALLGYIGETIEIQTNYSNCSNIFLENFNNPSIGTNQHKKIICLNSKQELTKVPNEIRLSKARGSSIFMMNTNKSSSTELKQTNKKKLKSSIVTSSPIKLRSQLSSKLN